MRPRPTSMLSLAIGGLLALGTSQGIGRFVHTPILPYMVADLRLSGGEAGLIASANFVGYLAGALFASLPRLPGERRLWMIAALATSAVTTAMTGLATALPALMAIRFAGGFASAIVLVFASALVLDRINAAGRSDLTAVHFSGIGFGILASSLAASALIGMGAGWRDLWFAAGGLSLAATLGVVRLVPPAPMVRPEPGLSQADGGGTWSGPLARFALAYGLLGTGYVITATFIVAIVKADPALGPLAPFVWPITGIAIIPSTAVWNAVARRIGVYRAFAAASLTLAFGVAASVLPIGWAGPILGAVLLGGTFVGMTSLGFVGARNLSGSDPRSVLGVMTAAFGVGQILGPVFAGFAYDLTGSFAFPSLTASAGLALSALLTWNIRPRAAE
ncbi:MAG TPA: YbfB/YjiJ family MFS transporter [Enterovirga sp.]